MLLILGCESTTEYERISLWPVLIAEKRYRTDASGEKSMTDEGSMFLLVHWNKRLKTDGEGTLVDQKEHVRIFPLLDAHGKEDADTKRSHGTAMLVFNYDNKVKKKTDSH